MDIEELDTILEDNTIADFLFSLKVAAQERKGGMAKLAEDIGVSRESLYKSLDPHSHPRFETILKVIKGLDIDIELKRIK